MDLRESANKPLFKAMLEAASACPHRREEEGGIVLAKDNEYQFVKVKNIHEGTDTAVGLYETDQAELKDRVLSKVGEGWKLFASFHTHPEFSPAPSSLDLGKLFNGFKYNVIYAPRMDMFSYSQWLGDKSSLIYIPANTLKNILAN
jgi:proteasome lid subunit RPN8/RPN11